MNTLCAPRDGFTLQKHQLFLKNNITNIKRILLFHGLGSGKTCTAISLAAAYMKHKSSNKKKVVVVTPASLKENLYKELMSLCGKTQLKDIIAINTPVNQTENKESVKSICSNENMVIKKIAEQYDKRVRRELNKKFEIMSYQGFVRNSKEKKLDLNNTLIIIDEVQNIISNTGETYKVFLKEFNKLSSKSKVILLSGTPMFDKAFEISLLSRLLQTKREFKKYHLPTDPRVFDMTFKIDANANNDAKKIQNKELLQDVFINKLSYIKGSDQRTYPKKVEHDVNCYMSSFQEKAYKKAIGHLDLNNFNANNMSRTFLISPRQASNIVLPSGRIGKLKNIDKSFNVQKHSTKFYNCLKNIKAQTGPTFVYSNFVSKAGVEDFAEILQNVEGYQLVEKDMCPVTKAKRFAIFRTGQPDENTRILKIFNSYENRNGDIIRIILGSPAMKEGITLLRVRQIHILDPYWNRSRTEQIIGRGVRYCSHKDLPENERRVDVYHYYAIPEKNVSTLTPRTSEKEAFAISVDKHIRKISDFKEKSIKVVNDLLKQVAIDCKHFKIQNELPNIKCIGTKSNVKFNMSKVNAKENNKFKNNNNKKLTKSKNNNNNVSIVVTTTGKITNTNKKEKKQAKPWAPTKAGKTGVTKQKSKYKGCPRPRHPTEMNDGTITCEENEKFKYLRLNPKGFPCCYSKSKDKRCASFSKNELVKMLEQRKLNTKGTKRMMCDRLQIK